MGKRELNELADEWERWADGCVRSAVDALLREIDERELEPPEPEWKTEETSQGG